MAATQVEAKRSADGVEAAVADCLTAEAVVLAARVKRRAIGETLPRPEPTEGAPPRPAGTAR